MAKQEKGVLHKKLDEVAHPSSTEPPRVAHVRALLNIFNGEPIPQEVKDVVIEYANQHGDVLKGVLDNWDNTVKLGLAKEHDSIALGTLSESIALSYGVSDREHLQLRKIELNQAFQIAALEQELERY